MKLGVREVATHMGVSENTVFRWVERDGLPATQVDGQFRFHPAAVYEWATELGLPVAGNLFGDSVGSLTTAPLTRAMRAGGIVAGLRGDDRRAVMAAAMERLPLPPHADRSVILQMLLARAKLGTVGVAEGFAIPHVRDPIVLRVAEPQVTLFLLEHPIDFGGHGRSRPVHALFLIVTPTIRGHLLILSRIGTALLDENVRVAIKDRAGTSSIIGAIETAEAALNGRVGG
jgi:PTS system nitrogen regulatory IIA component